MVGVVIASHGTIAQGMYESAKMFFGNDITQFTYVGLKGDQTAEELDEELRQAMCEVDYGDGVVVLADLFCGTPCNRAVMQMKDTTHIISGVNFPIVLELLGARQYNNVNLADLVKIGQDGVKYVNSIV